MQFILDTQARAEAIVADLGERQTKAERRMDRAEARMDRFEARMDRFERSLDGIRKLIQTGMKLMVQNQQDSRDLKAAMKELAREQKETQRNLNAFLASMRKGSNGRSHT
jgi:hypothetical protein